VFGDGLEHLRVRSGNGKLVGTVSSTRTSRESKDSCRQCCRVEVVLGMGPGRRRIRRPGERAVPLGTGEAGHHIGIRCSDLIQSDASRARRVDDEVAPTGAEPRGKLGL